MTFTCYNFSIPGPRKWINFALFVENTVCYNYSKHDSQLQWQAPKDIS